MGQTEMQSKESLIEHDAHLSLLAENIGDLVNHARQSSATLLNSVMIQTYWSIGKYIVEFEQEGNAKSQYGTSLLTKLSKLLTVKFGMGYSRPNLNNMRKFYIYYPNLNLSDMSDKLSWSHICELIKIEDALERKFYQNECVAEKWNVRSLRRQKNPLEPKDVVKNWLRSKNTLEYLGLWEMLNNPDFKGVEFDPLLKEVVEVGKARGRWSFACGELTEFCPLRFQNSRKRIGDFKGR